MKNKIHIYIIIALVSLGEITAQTFEVDGINYNITGSNEVRVTSKTDCYSGDVVIPVSVEDSGITYDVTAIGVKAFYYCTDLMSIVLPDSITEIQISAFNNCTNLVSINFPSAIELIDAYALWYCTSLISVDLSATSITSIGQYGFTHCDNLTTLILPNTLERIGDFNFYYCGSLTSVTIPTSVTSINQNGFGYSGLISIDIPDSVTNIDTKAFQVCNDLTTVTIPNSVISIGDYAFYSCGSLSSLNVNIDMPLSITPSVFAQMFRDTVTLNVPVGSEAAYSSAEVWQDFGSINGTLSINSVDKLSEINVYPNPSKNTITISGLKQSEDYSIYNVMGKHITKGKISNNNQVSIERFTNGLYFLKLENGHTIKFIKN